VVGIKRGGSLEEVIQKVIQKWEGGRSGWDQKGREVVGGYTEGNTEVGGREGGSGWDQNGREFVGGYTKGDTEDTLAVTDYRTCL